MKTNRELQRKILEHLQRAYPSNSDSVTAIDGGGETLGNLFYLKDHGMVNFSTTEFLDGSRKIHGVIITAKGIDFLEDDGGLGAILGTVTIKLHEDTLRQLIAARLQASDLPEEQKNGLLKALREAPSESIKQLTSKLVEVGLEQASKAGPLLHTLIQSALS